MKIHSSFIFPQAVPEVYDFLSLDEPETMVYSLFLTHTPIVLMWSCGLPLCQIFVVFEVSTLEVLYICITWSHRVDYCSINCCLRLSKEIKSCRSGEALG